MKELDLRSFFGILLQNLQLIVIVVAIIAVACGVATGVMTEDTYSSRCSMYVMNIAKDADDNYTGISATGLEASQRMVEEYIIILKSNSILNEVADRVNEHGYSETASSVRGSLDMSAVEGTALLRVIATTSDPDLSQYICNELMEYAPGRVNEIMNGLGSISPVDDAEKGAKNSPKIVRNAILGAVLGFLLVTGLIVVRHLMDNTVKDEKDLKKRFNVNVLGVVMDTSGSVDRKDVAANGKKTGGK